MNYAFTKNSEGFTKMEIYILDIWLSKLNYGWSIEDMPEKIRRKLECVQVGRQNNDSG